MPEAEVSLRLAFWLASQNLVDGPIEIAIDGAQVRTGETLHFDLPAFIREHGWSSQGTGQAWQAEYRSSEHNVPIRIHSSPGCGDVVARLKDGRTLRAECKKGPLEASKRSQEYPLIREALGQLLTVAEVAESDLLAVAVPESPRFSALAAKWRRAPLIQRFGIKLLTVSRSGIVAGFDPVAV